MLLLPWHAWGLYVPQQGHERMDRRPDFQPMRQKPLTKPAPFRRPETQPLRPEPDFVPQQQPRRSRPGRPVRTRPSEPEKEEEEEEETATPYFIDDPSEFEWLCDNEYERSQDNIEFHLLLLKSTFDKATKEFVIGALMLILNMKNSSAASVCETAIHNGLDVLLTATRDECLEKAKLLKQKAIVVRVVPNHRDTEKLGDGGGGDS